MDAITDTTTRYYYDDAQRVLLETDVDASETDVRYFVYGNYIDEVLVMRDVDSTNTVPDGDYFYGHDHLYSVVCLFGAAGAPAERYEYDAYGSVQILNSAFSILNSSQYANPYTFTGRRLDSLDSGRLELMYYRTRIYDPETGRFLQRDPLGIDPAGSEKNNFKPKKQYMDGMNLYEYVKSNPIVIVDTLGLFGTPGQPWPGIMPRPISLKGVGGGWECCSSVKEGIAIANKALQSQKCKDWFKNYWMIPDTDPHRRPAYGGEYKVRVRGNWKLMCAMGAYFYTWPFSNSIAACKVSCDLDAKTAALLMIHEIGHHYCTLGPGREDCANSAMEACSDGI